MELEGIINCSMCWRMVTHWLAGDNLLAEIFVCFLLFMIFFSVLLLYCVVCAPYALHSATFTHIVFDDFVVFRWSFVCFVCVWEWSVVRTSERCYRNIFIFFFFSFAIRRSGHWLTPRRSFGTVWYRTQCEHQRSDTKRNAEQKIVWATNETYANGLWKPTIEMIPSFQETNTIFKDHLLITTAYLSPLPSFIILIGRPSGSNRLGVLEMAAWIRMPVAKQKPQPYR